MVFTTKKDFVFIGAQINEDHIRKTPKEEYKKEIMKLIRTSAFTYCMNCKETHSKLDPIHYEKFEVQKYLCTYVHMYICSKLINNKHKKLLYLLRSRCFDAKYNFKKLFKKLPKVQIWLFGYRRSKSHIQKLSNIKLYMQAKKTT